MDFRNVYTDIWFWASRNGAVDFFFLTPTRNMFLAVFQEYTFYNVEWVELRKISEVFFDKKQENVIDKSQVWDF